jgi:hypothetical protein
VTVQNKDERDSLFADRFFERIGRPRRYRKCSTGEDFGMIEAGNQEDVCPTCEGGIWCERESWRWFIHRQAWLGWRVLFGFRRFVPWWVPTIRKDFPA